MAGGGKPVKFHFDPEDRIVSLDDLALQAGLEAYDPAKDREDARRRLAYSLLALLCFVAVSILLAEFTGLINLDEAKDLAVAIFSPIVALVGTALGFYFGGNHSD
jgi:hypothetical protein